MLFLAKFIQLILFKVELPELKKIKIDFKDI